MRCGAPLACVALAACIPHVDRPAPSPPRAAPRPPPPAAPPTAPVAPSRQDEPPRADEVTQLPAPPPAWETRPVSRDAAEIEDQDIIVRRGDTLSAISDRTRAGSAVIARANDLAPPFVVRAGQRLRIPGGRYHLVRRGQTGIAIARAYAVEWSRIVSANGFAEPHILRVGQRVLIPGADRPRSAAERAAAFKLDIDDILTGGEPALAVNQPPAKAVKTPRRVLPSTAAITTPVAAPGRFSWPVEGQIVTRFGRGGAGVRNDGVKIAVAIGTPIRAAADGTVAYVGAGIAALGGLVIIKHGGGWVSIYGHASKLLVQRGQAVKRGETIALSGASGFADRPELHFELRRGRTPVDPAGQLPRR